MSKTKKSNEKIRATLKKSFIDCMRCPKCKSDNYRRLKGDTILENGTDYDYIVRKYCEECEELHEYNYRLITDNDYSIIS